MNYQNVITELIYCAIYFYITELYCLMKCTWTIMKEYNSKELKISKIFTKKKPFKQDMSTFLHHVNITTSIQLASKKMGTHAHQYLVRYDKIFRLIATTGRCVVHCLCVVHYNIFNMLTNMVDSIDRLIRGMKAGQREYNR